MLTCAKVRGSHLGRSQQLTDDVKTSYRRILRWISVRSATMRTKQFWRDVYDCLNAVQANVTQYVYMFSFRIVNSIMRCVHKIIIIRDNDNAYARYVKNGITERRGTAAADRCTAFRSRYTSSDVLSPVKTPLVRSVARDAVKRRDSATNRT